ncbi:hypothetical protein JW835_15285 [bacterium]|nr:hypothetical protein [bacterium]
MRKAAFWITVSLILLMVCQKRTRIPDEMIIARIGDRTISKNEFIRRSEYTLRPAYCKWGDNTIHKKIILNSLIAEKLMALEAGENHALMHHINFQAYIRGRREQAMRKMLYKEEAYQKVELSDKEVTDLFQAAGRTYHLQYFNVPDSTTASEIQKYLKENPDQFVSVFEKYYGNTNVPERDVAWSDYEIAQVEEALFTQPLKNASVIGPLEIEKNQYLFMRINGWTDKRVFAEADVKKRWDRVKERLTLRRASVLWGGYISRVMRGKHLEFQEDTFYRLADILADVYHLQDREKQEIFNDRFWDRSQQNSDIEKITEAVKTESALLTAPLFTLDGKIFTVQDFRTMLASHPLVFRKRRFNRKEFPEQFKLAVVDLVADQYLNEKAYEKGLDRHPWVKRTEMMWQDAIVGMFHRNAYLDSIGKRSAFIENYMPVIRDDLNPYVQSLQKKYNNKIKINANLLKQIRLTRIDMFAVQKWEPYPVMVPQFPVVTDEHRMDYGKDMEQEKR